jgi:hypothetical protein
MACHIKGCDAHPFMFEWVPSFGVVISLCRSHAESPDKDNLIIDIKRARDDHEAGMKRASLLYP